jgi:hypothetical protein
MQDYNRLLTQIDASARNGKQTGPLPEPEIARGAHLCWQNAVSLLSDARLLAKNSRLARALSLTVLALE